MTEADGSGLSRLLVLAQGAQVGCQVVGRDEGVGMVVTQHAATPGEGVLVEGAGPGSSPDHRTWFAAWHPDLRRSAFCSGPA
jgi:hypothetical protein